MDSVAQWLLGGGTAGAVVYGLSVVVRAIAGRPLVRATAADRLSESAIKLIESAQKAADDAGKDAAAARQEANEARREAADARRAADNAERVVHYFRAAILSPNATLDGLRAMVNEGPGNGAFAVREGR